MTSDERVIPGRNRGNTFQRVPHIQETQADFERAATGDATAAERLWFPYEDGARFLLGRKLTPERVSDALRQVHHRVRNAFMQGAVDRGKAVAFVRSAVDDAIRSLSEGGHRTDRVLPSAPTAREMLAGLFRDFGPVEVLALSRFYLDGKSADQICDEFEMHLLRFAAIQNRAKERFMRVFYAKTPDDRRGLETERLE